MTDKSEKDKKIVDEREKALDELVRQSEEMGFYDTQMSVANKVMEEDREVLKGLCVDELDEKTRKAIITAGRRFGK